MNKEFTGLKSRIDQISNNFYENIDQNSQDKSQNLLKKCFDMNLDVKIELEKTQTEFKRISLLEEKRTAVVARNIQNFLRFK